MLSVMYIFSSKEVVYFNQLEAEVKEGNLRVSYIAIYRLIAVMPLVSVIDLGLFVGVPVYLAIVFRSKLLGENSTISNLVELENCFDSYISNEIKYIKAKMYSAGTDGISH